MGCNMCDKGIIFYKRISILQLIKQMKFKGFQPSKLFSSILFLLMCQVGCLEQTLMINEIKSALIGVDKKLSRNLGQPVSSEGQMETIIYFMGMPGTGKSTLINYLLGNSLIYKQKGRRFEIAQEVQDQNFPKIGRIFQSEANISEAYRDSASKILYEDHLGFINTKDLLEEIADSYAFSRIIAPGKKIKIVLVVDNDAIKYGRGYVLMKSENKIKQLFPTEFAQIADSVAIIVTKVPRLGISKDNIVELIRDTKEYHENNFDESISDLLETILQNNRIYILPTPDHKNIDAFVQEIQVELVKDQENSMKPYQLKKNPKPHLSASARILVKEFKFSIQQQIRESRLKILPLIQAKFQKYISSDVSKIAATVSSEQFMKIIEEISSFSKVAARKNLTPEQTRSVLEFIGFIDQQTLKELLRNLDYLRYFGNGYSFDRDENVEKFFYYISEALLETVNRMQTNVEIVKIYEDHQNRINKIKQQQEAKVRKIQQQQETRLKTAKQYKEMIQQLYQRNIFEKMRKIQAELDRVLKEIEEL